MAKDPYTILGISKSASPDDIKKAYRQMSKEWHPDKHKGDKAAEEKFKEINQAYETLSSPEKKKTYDQFGSAGGPGGGGSGGFDFSGFNGSADFGDLFENFFGGQRTQRRESRAEGSDIEIDIDIDFADVIGGAKKRFRLQKIVTCTTCEGRGAEKGSQLITCGTCNGTGQVTRTVNSFFGQIRQATVCNTCEGSGKIPKNPCKTCKGSGRTQQTSEVTIDIPAGIDSGQVLRIRGQGNAGLRGAAAGDLYARVHVRSDSRFERDGSDIRTSISVPVLDAILGGSVTVETVHGPTTLQVPEGMQPNQVFRIRGKGLPQLGSSKMGDHYVVIGVEVPKKLSKSERKILEEWKKLRQ